VFTLAFNVDSLLVARTLWTNAPVREAVAAAASQQGSAIAPVADEVARLQRLDLPIGWSSAPGDPRRAPDDLAGWLAKLAGLALTVLALSFGASFWFDLLGKAVRLRGTGHPPAPA
jgi:hypothetical protein